MSLNQGFSSFPGVTELKNCADTWTPIYQILLKKEILITSPPISSSQSLTVQPSATGNITVEEVVDFSQEDLIGTVFTILKKTLRRVQE